MSMTIVLNVRTSSPRLFALSSPRANRLSLELHAQSTSPETITMQVGMRHLSHETMSPSDPICHRYAFFRVSASVVTINVVSIPLKMYERAIPTRIMVAGLMRMALDNPISMNAGIRPPMKALTIIPIEPRVLENVNPVTMAATAPKQAPSETPVVYESARGLFMTLCMATPQIARPAPMEMPMIMRGR